MDRDGDTKANVRPNWKEKLGMPDQSGGRPAWEEYWRSSSPHYRTDEPASGREAIVEPVSVNDKRVSGRLHYAKTEIGKSRTETGRRNSRFSARKWELVGARDGVVRANARNVGTFPQRLPARQNNGTVWLTTQSLSNQSPAQIPLLTRKLTANFVIFTRQPDFLGGERLLIKELMQNSLRAVTPEFRVDIRERNRKKQGSATARLSRDRVVVIWFLIRLGGSGSTLIAAERTGRKARVLELDPHYCDVIVRRWQVDLAIPIS
jgi:hypothetical protein